jgi:hypothetical protein
MILKIEEDALIALRGEPALEDIMDLSQGRPSNESI